MAGRVHTLAEIAAMFDVHERTLARRRVGDRIVFDDSTWLRVIIIGRKAWVPDAELARFLGERLDAAS